VMSGAATEITAGGQEMKKIWVRPRGRPVLMDAQRVKGDTRWNIECLETPDSKSQRYASERGLSEGARNFSRPGDPPELRRPSASSASAWTRASTSSIRLTCSRN